MNVYTKPLNGQTVQYQVDGTEDHQRAIEMVVEDLELMNLYAHPVLAVINGGKQ